MILDWCLYIIKELIREKAGPMQIPAKISFHNVDASAALETRIREKIAKLEKRFPNLVGLSVVVDSAHHHQQKGRLYTVKIDVTLPGGELVVSMHPGKNPTKHDKIFAAMNDAFLAIEKQLIRFRAPMRKETKSRAKHWQIGVVSNISSDDGFGFLTTGDGEIYFHKNAVENERFSELDIGSKVRFVSADQPGNDGPHASVVRLPGRNKVVKEQSA